MNAWAKHSENRGFTIVELLISIVVVAILAAIVVVGYNGIQNNAKVSKTNADLSNLTEAILTARQATGRTLGSITGSYWSIGSCSTASGNPGNIEPKNLPTTHACWQRYYTILNNISAASGVELTSLRSGDANGNPYMFDENEGEHCGVDTIFTYVGNGTAATTVNRTIPRLAPC